MDSALRMGVSDWSRWGLSLRVTSNWCSIKPSVCPFEPISSWYYRIIWPTAQHNRWHTASLLSHQKALHIHLLQSVPSASFVGSRDAESCIDGVAYFGGSMMIWDSISIPPHWDSLNAERHEGGKISNTCHHRPVLIRNNYYSKEVINQTPTFLHFALCLLICFWCSQKVPLWHVT